MQNKLLKSTLIMGAFVIVSTLSYFAYDKTKQSLYVSADSLLAENLEALSNDAENELAYRHEALTWIGKIDIGVGPQEHLNEEVHCSNDSCWITKTANLTKCDGEGTSCAHWRIQRATVSHSTHQVYVPSCSGPEEPTNPRVLQLIAQYQN